MGELRCQACKGSILHGMHFCPHCQEVRPEIHLAVKDCIEKGRFTELGEISAEGNVIFGFGQRTLWGRTLVFLGFALMVAGWNLPELFDFGVKAGILGAFMVFVCVVTGKRKRFTLDFSVEPPRWNSNDDDYWHPVQKFYFPKAQRIHSVILAAKHVIQGVAIFGLIGIAIVGYLVVNPKAINSEFLNEASSARSFDQLVLIAKKRRERMKEKFSQMSMESPLALARKKSTATLTNSKSESSLDEVEDDQSYREAKLADFLFPPTGTRMIWAEKTGNSFQPIRDVWFEQKGIDYFEARVTDFISHKQETERWESSSEGLKIFSQGNILLNQWPQLITLGLEIGNGEKVRLVDAEIELPWKSFKNCIQTVSHQGSGTKETFYCKGYGRVFELLITTKGSRVLMATANLLIHERNNFVVGSNTIEVTKLTDRCEKEGGSICEEAGIVSEIYGDPEKARAMYFKGCQTQFGRSCMSLAHLDERRGKLDSAVRFYDEACLRGYFEACQYEARIYQDKGQLQLAETKYEVACKNGEHRSCAALGRIHLVRNEVSAATVDFQKACASGPTFRCEELLKLNRAPASEGLASPLLKSR